MQTLATVRDGLFLEIAGAAGWRFPDAVWSRGQFDRWGIWVTPSYVGRTATVIGVLRYVSEDADAGTTEGLVDYGFRGVHFRERYAMSVEYVRRSFRDSRLTGGNRLVGIAEYAVTDSLWLVTSFGRDYDAGREGSLVARVGASFGFRRERYLTASGAPDAVPSGRDKSRQP